MKLKIAAVAALLAVGSVGASAGTFDWGVHTDFKFGVNIVSGDFTDWWQFEISPEAVSVASTAVANNLGNGFVLNVANGKYSLWSFGDDDTFGAGSGDDEKLGGVWDFDGASGNLTNSVLLEPGKYYYQVTGNGNGSLGGAYMLTSTTAPIPEPETYAMMLAGLGVLGFLASRRRRED